MEGIELKDFIKSTLVEIAEGVREANQGLMGSGKSQHDIFNLRRNFGDSSKIPGIIFDIAVTATSN
ncbi:MAG: hypothetical protein Dbin4_03066 [Alphaproteobacteria bacterium]|nr:hypothetical protein [Alphaproteobacteria bacterium]